MKKLRHAVVIGGELALSFEDGEERFVSLARLREACPCAACTGAHGPAEPALIHQQSDPRLTRLAGIQPVGSYALNLTWEDGHSAGIYSFEYLSRIND